MEEQYLFAPLLTTQVKRKCLENDTGNQTNQ